MMIGFRGTLIDMARNTHDLQRNGFDLISVTEPDLCSDDRSRKCMRQIMGAFHEYEKTMIVIKLRGARQRAKAKQGACEGRKAYGFYPGGSDILTRMHELRSSGMTATDIATTLKAEGFKTRSGGKWLQPTVSKILNRSGQSSAGKRGAA